MDNNAADEDINNNNTERNNIEKNKPNKYVASVIVILNVIKIFVILLTVLSPDWIVYPGEGKLGIYMCCLHGSPNPCQFPHAHVLKAAVNSKFF